MLTGTQRITFCFWIFVIFLSIQVSADIKSTTGNILFDVDSDGLSESQLDGNGLGIGTGTVSANLHVVGNATVSDEVRVGTTAGNSTLEVNGSLGFGIETVSDNTQLSGNSIILGDTSSANVQVLLPDPANVDGRVYQIKKISASNELSVGGYIIDGNAGLKLTTTTVGFPFVKLAAGANAWHMVAGDGFGSLTAMGTTSDNLLGWWTFDETVGTTVQDYSGNGNHGVLTNGMTMSANGFSGNINHTLGFGEGDGFVDLPAKYVLDEVASSLSLWFYTGFNSVGSGMMVGHDTVNHTYIYASSTTVIAVQTDSPGTIKNYTVPTMSSDTWYHLVVTRNAGNTRVYLNTTESSSGAQAQSPDLSIDQFAKYSNSGTFWYDGRLDDIRIYNKVLSAGEIQTLYQLGQ